MSEPELNAARPTATPPSTPGLLPAMVLAAGRGERMRPLTDRTPKPLLQVHGRALLDWRLLALARDGVRHVCINTAWLGEQIEVHCGSVWQPETTLPPLALTYSREGQDFGHALETAGGICRALRPLGEMFWVGAADIHAPDYRLDADTVRRFAASTDLAHLWLVPNPAHNPRGDFGLDAQGRALNVAREAPPDPACPHYTFSTFALYRSGLFAPPWCDIPPGNPQGQRLALAPLLRKAMDAGRVGASLYTGRWEDVGTPERLAQLNASAAVAPPTFT